MYKKLILAKRKQTVLKQFAHISFLGTVSQFCFLGFSKNIQSAQMHSPNFFSYMVARMNQSDFIIKSHLFLYMIQPNFNLKGLFVSYILMYNGGRV